MSTIVKMPIRCKKCDSLIYDTLLETDEGYFIKLEICCPVCKTKFVATYDYYDEGDKK